MNVTWDGSQLRRPAFSSCTFTIIDIRQFCVNFALLKVTFAFLQWLSCSGQQLLKMHEEVKIKDYLHRQKLRPFCGSSRILSSSFSWFSCFLVEWCLCYESTCVRISSAITGIRQDIGYNHCDSDLALDTTLTPSHSDATDSQPSYCDTEPTPGETHISMLDCLLSCYNCCGSLWSQCSC